MSSNPQMNVEELDKIFHAAQRFSDKKMFAEAEKGFAFLLKVLPTHPHILSSYGKHNANQKKFDVAEKYIKQAIKLTPNDLHVLLDLAAYYSSSEDYKNYVPTLKKVLEIDPTDPYAIINYAYYLMITRDYAELEKFALESLQLKLSQPDAETFKIALAIIYHLKNEPTKTAEYLEGIEYYISEQAVTDEAAFPLRRSFRVYYLYLNLLLQWRKENPEYYTNPTLQKIYVVGDSHSLGAANSIGNGFAIESKLVIDCSAWQLAGSGKKLKKHVFKNALKDVEKGAKVVLSFGEIDCRPNLCTHSYLCKNPDKNYKTVIAELVRSYVDVVSKFGKNRDVDLHLLNCPAPKKSSICNQIVGDDHIAGYKRIITEFNQQLAQQAAAANLKIIDIYAATHQADGWSNEELYLDDVHFKPSLLIDLLNK